MYCNLSWGGRLVRILHIAGWWVGHGFKPKVVSDTTLGGCLNEKSGKKWYHLLQNGIFL